MHTPSSLHGILHTIKELRTNKTLGTHVDMVVNMAVKFHDKSNSFCNMHDTSFSDGRTEEWKDGRVDRTIDKSKYNLDWGHKN